MDNNPSYNVATPGAGNNPASEIYVRGKVKSSEEVGLYSEKHTPPESVTTLLYEAGP